MTDALAHRGPDADGLWLDGENGVGLGHRRLSILDLSPAGAQPMLSPDGRYAIAFNGEIYNHLDLRATLASGGAAPDWRGSSDTETLLAAVEAWGLDTALRKAKGMFALALWDRRENALYLARDRMGEKPLYLASLPGGWGFASELKALLQLPVFSPRLCHDAIGAYLAYGYVPQSHCIFEGVRKIEPGHITRLALDDLAETTRSYETFHDLVRSGYDDRADQAGEPVDRLEKVLGDVVEEQMLSDVPLGCFLSGGVDSSLIAALMQSRKAGDVRTFAIGFDEERFNEAPHAAAVARHLGTDHTEFILREQDALAVIPQMPEIYDEPFADSSQIPTVLLCREARRNVTVALTGDGGDEVFGGYNRHVIGPGLLARVQSLPRFLRQVGGGAVTMMAPAIVPENSILRRTGAKLGLPVTALDNLVKIAPRLTEIDTLPALYDHFTQSIHPSESPVHNRAPRTLARPEFDLTGAEWMMAMDSVTYLPGDILVKVDRAAMAASLETRAPFLDARVVRAAWSMPIDAKIGERRGKQVLRSLLDRFVPRDLIDRPKQGFAIPLDRWLRGELRGWASDLLENDELIGLAGLDTDRVSMWWNQHQSGSANHGTRLWTILMLLDWLRHYRHRLVPARADHKVYEHAESTT